MTAAESQDFVLKEDDKNKSQKTESRLPAINFSTFVFSLNSSALVHLGVIADPVSGKTEKNLAVAKHTIDIIGMLKEKTAGNLTDDEKGLLETALRDLRILYVKEKDSK
ncbi:DUF1844 domain-containing protein [Desulfosudis oleivorans]|uniref:DUF1844 domain-containing protein n=1 Tax=Desulfosudis oleivorans (strain DSM 6200 / JCM 39069 / Hxd3) TaxID=96561 RepID=A8ZXZ0_DESOH|nr:DUF1844 domain-containing protein [Desulfosudis oleivorans]ABW68617.1 Domain of unknown function DUF1844 [Desulfosudis oleivorans Hxd3]